MNIYHLLAACWQQSSRRAPGLVTSPEQTVSDGERSWSLLFHMDDRFSLSALSAVFIEFDDLCRRP
jgi:hypothetical protein